jgi:chromatin licensing and DNA replication factor 1
MITFLDYRKFLYSHLAQMKHLFPEAIQIKKILLHDEKSLCMYPDIEIALVMDVVECKNPDQPPSMTLCEAFYSKLLGFLDAHHKVLNLINWVFLM